LVKKEDVTQKICNALSCPSAWQTCAQKQQINNDNQEFSFSPGDTYFTKHAPVLKLIVPEQLFASTDQYK